jgi:hypothetical protein
MADLTPGSARLREIEKWLSFGRTESRAREERTGSRLSAREDAVAVIGWWELPLVADE